MDVMDATATGAATARVTVMGSGGVIATAGAGATGIDLGLLRFRS